MDVDLQKVWDVIVVGTGIGGGTVGRRLTEAGLSVLLIEKGPLEIEGVSGTGEREETDPELRLKKGLWPMPAIATIDGRVLEFFAPIGASVGGTSTFYAAVLERPERHDLDHSDERPHPTGGWPVSYDTLEPYFEIAEELFEVCGTNRAHPSNRGIALRPAPALEDQDRVMAESFTAQGLKPYHIHVAARFLPGCQNCFGFRCKRQCKLDGRSAGVDPALATGNAVLLDECEVRGFGATDDSVSHVRISRHGKELEISARAYVLAAGALSSPRLLLASQSAEWPKGIGNRNDLVGRFLMFHLMELVAVWPGRGRRSSGPSKALALRDFYFVDGQRFGIVQAMGIDTSYGTLVHYLNGIFDRSLPRKLRSFRGLTRIPAYIAAKVFGSAKMFSATIEDLPYRDNRVTLDPNDPDRLHFQYTLPAELCRRRDAFRHILRRRIHDHKLAFLSVQPQLNFAHSCGTLCFGEDPATSVLDVNCRVHGVRNLYVADSSFMPTSLGINPSLTIAANAVRVADKIAAMLGLEMGTAAKG